MKLKVYYTYGLQTKLRLGNISGSDFNAGRGLQPQSKCLYASKRRYIIKSRYISSVIFQRQWQYQTFETGL